MLLNMLEEVGYSFQCLWAKLFSVVRRPLVYPDCCAAAHEFDAPFDILCSYGLHIVAITAVNYQLF